MSRSTTLPRTALRRLGWLAVMGLLLAAFAGPTAAAPDAGNNGTVKIHEGATETEPIVQNNPHVCTFHLHFFFADPLQAGSWEIQEWAPGDDKGTVVLSGTYDTNGDGEDRQPTQGVYELPDGHYKLFWDGDVAKHDKQKVFWVDCDAVSSTTTTGTTTTGTTTTGTTTTGTTTTGTTTAPGQAVLGETGTPSQSVLGETGLAIGNVNEGPTMTMPPTDMAIASGSDAETSGPLLISIAALLALILVLSPRDPASLRARR